MPFGCSQEWAGFEGKRYQEEAGCCILILEVGVLIFGPLVSLALTIFGLLPFLEQLP
jgi:hypothetical protein